MLNDAQQKMLTALKELQEFQPTPEEERILDEFEEFQRQHPITFSSLDEEAINELTDPPEAAEPE
jgi:hypothetical protein